MRVLVVDDDPTLRTALTLMLSTDGYTVTTASNGQDALARLEQFSFDLVLLDYVMPRLDGLETCRCIRARWGVPILMVTARIAESDKVTVLGAGADDYVTKPFGPRELRARVGALIRRSRMGAVDAVPNRIGDLEMDTNPGHVSVGGRDVKLSPREHRLLSSLSATPGQVRRIQELAMELGAVDPTDREAQELVKTNVARLRRKIEADPQNPTRVISHRGFGYSINGVTSNSA